MNPVFNKGEWNTSHIEDYVKRVGGVKIIKYPWLQWNGYWPDAKKIKFGKSEIWNMPSLNQLASNSSTFNEFYEKTFDQKNFHLLAEENLESTTNKLKDNERRGLVDINFADWILENYRTHRLFLTPDHPSTYLYKKLISEISKISGIKLDPQFYHTSTELQEGVRLPIIPGIEKSLGLNFSGIEWAHKEIFPTVNLSYATYLKTIYKPESLYICRAKQKTVFKIIDVNGEEVTRRPVRPGEKFLVKKSKVKCMDYHTQYKIYDAIESSMNIEAVLYNQHWDVFSV